MQSFKGALRAGLAVVAVLGVSALTALSASGSADAAPRGYCGSDSVYGLAVFGSAGTSCSTALEVANAYRAHGSSGSPATVRVGGIVWRCQEYQGDPNPFDRCVATAGPSRWVELTS
ncbi:hypothetical protein SSP24_64390 [Streptomyces spinoverrucosus]|uniref:Secreted protein n=1 Tax=Streptomyces spinoverrucosus TaxID=284043 RepID=A0A4Y3VPB6_9ACTN|nr:hypothetical protein SSP24_64390 [Streptomyces spinoverrucosus]GHB88915.1 hypothetical protein GCM10010397_71100 [Streptomyces spinoverrucosus]